MRYYITTYICVGSDEMNSVVVSTAPTRSDSELDQPLVISIELNDGSRLVANHKFEYKINPRFSDIEPRNHLVTYVLYDRDSAALYTSFIHHKGRSNNETEKTTEKKRKT